MGKQMKKQWMVPILALMMTFGIGMTAWAYYRLATVEDVWWDDDNVTVATWETVEEAYQYEIYLYCDEEKVASVKTKKERYNFESKMTKGGEYTFRVRALAKDGDRDYRDGGWSDYSDGCYIDEAYAEMVRNGGKIDTDHTGPAAKPEDGVDGTSGTGVVPSGKWVQDAVGWWYQKSDGTYPANGWFQDPASGIWYFMNPNGYMMTGWIDWNGNRYYCGQTGAMVTGAQTIDGVNYVFDASGALQASA